MLEIAECVVDHGPPRFCGVAPAPIGHPEPIAELQPVLARLDAARTDQGAAEQNDKASFAVTLIDGRNKLFGIADAIRIRDARRVLRDAAVVGQHGNRFNVLVTRCAQRQPLGLEDGNTALSPGLVEDVFRQGHDGLLK